MYIYKQKYLKYKSKYLELKKNNMKGGADASDKRYIGISITNKKLDKSSTSYFFSTLFTNYDLFNIKEDISKTSTYIRYDYLIITGHCSKATGHFSDDDGTIYSPDDLVKLLTDYFKTLFNIPRTILFYNCNSNISCQTKLQDLLYDKLIICFNQPVPRKSPGSGFLDVKMIYTTYMNRIKNKETGTLKNLFIKYFGLSIAGSAVSTVHRHHGTTTQAEEEEAIEEATKQSMESSAEEATKRSMGSMAVAASTVLDVHGHHRATTPAEEEATKQSMESMAVDVHGHHGATTPAGEEAAIKEATTRSMVSGNYLCIMRHSLRLDIELDKINKSIKEQMPYYINGQNYNTPIADLEILEGNIGTKRIIESFRGFIHPAIKFSCIITSPFTRCLETTKIVAKLLGIPPTKIFINYNLKEVKSARDRYTHSTGKDFNIITSYNEPLIAELGYKIEEYINQDINNIFSTKIKLGNVLIVTHGDIFNRFINGRGMLDEAGWAIFKCNTKSCDYNIISSNFYTPLIY